MTPNEDNRGRLLVIQAICMSFAQPEARDAALNILLDTSHGRSHLQYILDEAKRAQGPGGALSDFAAVLGNLDTAYDAGGIAWDRRLELERADNTLGALARANRILQHLIIHATVPLSRDDALDLIELAAHALYRAWVHADADARGLGLRIQR